MNEYVNQRSILSALISSVLIIALSVLLSVSVLESGIYRQSKIAGFIISNSEDNKSQIISDPKIFVKFVRAVANAYVNFDMIPIHEAATFFALAESTDDDINIDDLAYESKTLLITGTAKDIESFDMFLEKLSQSEHFRHVTSHYYTTKKDQIKFSIECSV